MNKIYHLFTFLFLSVSGMSQAICGFDEMHKKTLSTDSEFANQLRKNEKLIKQFAIDYANNPQVNGTGTALFEIPVVVHVVHTGGEVGSIYNPNDARITGVIDYLNKVFDGTADGMSGGVGDIQIQFALAKRDPNCNPTNGIVHFNAGNNSAYVANGVNRSNSNGISDLALKNLSRWNSSQYYNIWLVNKIDGADGTSGQFIAGYAYFPGAPANLDGSVMLATQMEVDNKVLPHEIGHALQLYHPFEGSNDVNGCPINDDCSENGDKVCDTDPISNNTTDGVTDFTCRTGMNDCAGGNQFSPNTEANIMSYTNCFRLFTHGQKIRMLGAMDLPSRASLATSLGATPTNLGATQCPPKIVFENTSIGLIEDASAAKVDCRTYNDYDLNMIIGNSPSAAATATLTTTGTATAGVDYVITTNGNFVTPSNVVSFPAGQNGLIPFTLRVFDDGAVEEIEKISINFTVNNGGGDALKGEINTTLNLTLYDDDIEPEAIIAGSAYIGEYSANVGTPFGGNYANLKGQMIYSASELLAAGLQGGIITQIAFYVAQKNSTIPFNGFTLKLKNVTENNIPSTPISGATTVFGPTDYSTIEEDNVFVLTNPFVWDGVSNVLLEVCWGNGAATSAADLVACTFPLGGKYRFSPDNAVNGCNLNSLLFSYKDGGLRPLAGFSILWSGPGIETVLNRSSASYLGPNSDVYFYSAGGDILARVKNNSSHDYGCTEVKIDRAGNSTKGLVNNTAKNKVTDRTISIIPTINNPEGNYDLTLFYKLAEVQGWEAGTGLLWSEAKIIKTKNAVSTYTVGEAPMAQVQEKTGIKASYGPDTTITANFTNGFSGFAVGNITDADVLPVTWLEFKGALQTGNAVLIWKVQEMNNAAFELEISRNGQDFVSLYKTASKGNYNGANIYQHKQARPEPGINYYRVKQIDLDGRFTYSQTITLTVDGTGGGKPFVFPVPAKNTIVLNFGEILTRGSWEILTADMRLIQRQKLSASALQQQINIGMLPAGVYFIRLVTNNNQEMLRFIKE